MGEVSLNVTAFVPYFSDFTFLQDLVIVCTCFTFNLCELGLVWCLYEYVTSNLCELAMLCMIILTWELLVLRSSACDKLRLASQRTCRPTTFLIILQRETEDTVM